MNSLVLVVAGFAGVSDWLSKFKQLKK